jgi:hypothetical protein
MLLLCLCSLFTIHCSFFSVSLFNNNGRQYESKNTGFGNGDYCASVLFMPEKNEVPSVGTVFNESDVLEVVVNGNTGYVLRPNASLMVLDADTGAETDTVKWAVTKYW